MKEIVLNDGSVALVDDEDFEKVSAYPWRRDRKGYAVFNTTFDDQIEAARAYNEAAKKHFGDFAKLNPV